MNYFHYDSQRYRFGLHISLNINHVENVWIKILLPVEVYVLSHLHTFMQLVF
jgi:hypothetical protein